MAKQLLYWKLIGTVQNVGPDKDTFEHTYDLKEIYPTIVTMTEVQREIIAYGVKQKLADCVSSESTYFGKIGGMDGRWEQLVDGIWKVPGKDRVSVKKKADEMVASGELNETELALLKKLGLRK